MRVALDISCTRGRRAGIGWYASNLLSAIAKIDQNNDYLLYTFYSRARDFEFNRMGLPAGMNFRLEQKRIPFRVARFLLDRSVISINSLLGPFDVFHALAHTAPPFASGKLVATIHDVAYLRYPDRRFTDPERGSQGASRLRALAERADLIIAVSERTKQDIQDVLGIPQEKIRVVYEAAEECFKLLNQAALSDVKSRYHLPERFVLFVGTMEPRKNVPLLLKAHHALKLAGKLDHKLVLVGKLGWHYDATFDLVTELRLQDDVIFLGHIPREDLPAVYNLADLFVYPSFYEGFGLPPLEAMACGTPVIASRSSCFPEILGEAATLIDPEDVADAASKVHMLMTDSGLRARFRALGMKKAAEFSWERAARDTVQIYEEASQS